MEIVLSATVFAALITSLVNIRIAFISSKNSQALERFKQELGLEVAKQLEFTKAKIRAEEIGFAKIWELRTFIKSKNAYSLLKEIGEINSESFTKLCVEDIPEIFIKFENGIEECSVYLKQERLDAIERVSKKLRESMRLLHVDFTKELAGDMLLCFAEYAEVVEKQLDEATSIGLDEIKR